jgi:hypothetical protein
MSRVIPRCLIAAVLFALAVPASAGAWTVSENLTVGQALLPADHPCKSATVPAWVPGLRDDDGHSAGAAANVGHRDASGSWLPMSCVVSLNPVSWQRWDACEQRRAVLHEFGHLSGLSHAARGLMSTNIAEQDAVAVLGCPALIPTVRDRVVSRVLGLVPGGWAVACQHRRGRVMRCRADDGRGRAAWFRARGWDAVWSGFSVVKFKQGGN